MGIRPAKALAAAIVATTLAGCGASGPSHTQKPAATADREWVANARQLVGTLESDLGLSGSGGANLATARRAMSDTSSIYTMLVAYTLFGDCTSALANVGVPTAHLAPTAKVLETACRQLEASATLFQQAMTAHRPAELLSATRAALAAAPLLAKAKDALEAARVG